MFQFERKEKHFYQRLRELIPSQHGIFYSFHWAQPRLPLPVEHDSVWVVIPRRARKFRKTIVVTSLGLFLFRNLWMIP